MNKYTPVSSKVLYNHKRIQLVEEKIKLPNGNTTDYLLYENLPDSAVLVAQNAENKILLLNEYTYPIDKYLLQMPAGVIEVGEDPKDGAIRELQEEAGLKAVTLECIGSALHNHRRSTSRSYYFIAKGLTTTKTNREEHEFMNMKWYSVLEVQELIKKGKIIHQGSLAAWGLFLNNVVNLQQK